jgi:hypothetical protein
MNYYKFLFNYKTFLNLFYRDTFSKIYLFNKKINFNKFIKILINNLMNFIIH